MENIRLIIVDDHALIADGIRKTFESQIGVQVIASVSSAIQLFEILKKQTVDLIIMDINLPGMNGIEATELLKSMYPSIKVIGLSMHDDTGYINKMIKAGASGYLLKTVDAEELHLAVKKVMQGKNYFSAELINETINPSNSLLASDHDFTKRELEILVLLVKGFTNLAISEQLSISIRTVEKHRSHIYLKAGTSNTPGLIRFAFTQGLI